MARWSESGIMELYSLQTVFALIENKYANKNLYKIGRIRFNDYSNGILLEQFGEDHNG